MTRLSRLALVWLVAASAATTQDAQENRRSLKGLRGVHVLVEDLDAAAERAGLNKTTIQTDVELKLRQAGIRVWTEQQRALVPGGPFLYIAVTVIELSTRDSYIYLVDVSLRQMVCLARDAHICVFDAPTWDVPDFLGIAPRADLATVLRQHVKDYADRFINAYLSVNPR